DPLEPRRRLGILVGLEKCGRELVEQIRVRSAGTYELLRLPELADGGRRLVTVQCEMSGLEVLDRFAQVLAWQLTAPLHEHFVHRGGLASVSEAQMEAFELRQTEIAQRTNDADILGRTLGRDERLRELAAIEEEPGDRELRGGGLRRALRSDDGDGLFQAA